MSGPVLRAEGLSRSYRTGGTVVQAVDDVSLRVEPGELVVLRGRSGAGKTTLLNLLGGLDQPDSGHVLLGDLDLATAGEAELTRVRRDRLGFVFQNFALLPHLSAAENIELPLRIARTEVAERDERVTALLAAVGLAGHRHQRPGELSGGQQQRVGLARALAVRPDLLIADEPTGQLDSRTAAEMIEMIAELVHAEGIAAIVSTHDPAIAERADRTLEMRDGRLVSRHGRHVAQVGAE